MSNLIIRKLPKSEIDKLTINPGQLFITDDINKNIIYDNESFSRDNITNFCEYYTDYNIMMSNSEKFQINRIYIDLSTNKFYGIYTGAFKPLETTEEVDYIINNIDTFKAGIMQDINGTLKIPVTTVNQILTDKGVTFDEALDESKLLRVVRTKVVRCYITKDNLRVLPIPFPKENYNLENGDKLIVIKDNEEFSTSKYVINNRYLILNEDEPPFQKGDLYNYIFYYQMTYDLNAMVQLGTQNYADGSVTTEKLSPYIEFSADKVLETQDRLFFTPEEKNKLKGIAEGATRYFHPDTHPANMITEEKDRHFVTDAQIKKIADSCTLETVYSKTQVDKMFQDIVGGAPEMLDTLKEICDAFNNDENFATNITKMIEERALQTDLEKIETKLDTKTNNRDYIRNGIYQKTTKTAITGTGDVYNVKVDDSELLQYVDGMLLILKIDDTNYRNSFIRINTLDTIPILNPEMEELIQGELKKGCIYHFRFDGTEKNFILQGKGGVELRDTTLKEYTVEPKETILRGKLIDKLKDGNIVNSRPKLLLKTINNCTEPKYYANGKVYSFFIDDNKIMAFWKYEKSLRCKVMKVTNDYIDIDELQYTELSTTCFDYTVVQSNNCFIVSISSSDSTLLIKAISNNEYSIVISSSEYIRSEDDIPVLMSSVKISKNKAILSYRLDDTTRILFISTSFVEGIYKLDILSNRSNIGYPINKICKISDRQIVFGTVENKDLILWVMNVEGSDFSFCSKVKIYTDKNDNLSNLGIYRINDTKIRISWTNSSVLKYYTQLVEVNAIGGLLEMPITQKDMTGDYFHTYQVNYQEQLYDNFYLSVSNYNHKIPSTNNKIGMNCIKVSINKECDMFNITDEFCNIFNTSSIHHFNIKNNKLLVCYCDKENIGSLDHLYFMIFNIVKSPIGLSMEIGQGEQKIKIKEWN